MKRGGATLHDVAIMAHCSDATVSRVINNPGQVRAELRHRVRAAIKALNYKVTTLGLVGLIIPDRSNPFFVDLGLLFQDRLEHHGLITFLVSSDGHPEKELALVKRCLALGLQGIIYIPAHAPAAEVLEALDAADVPVVIFDRKVAAARHDSVSLDNANGMVRAVDYLASHGHKQIGHLSGPLDTHTGRARYDGFVYALELNGLAYRDEFVWHGAFSSQDGWAVGDELVHLADRPTAIVCANDLMALGLAQRLHEEGWTVPDDLSIIGFDDIDATRWSSPPLTTVSQQIVRLVDVASDLLADRLESRPAEPAARDITISPRLVPRASVSAPPSRSS